MSDPAKYRKKEEVEDVKQQSDPLLLTANRLKTDFGYTQEQLDSIAAEADAEAQKAYDFAEKSPIADVSRLYDYVYAE